MIKLTHVYGHVLFRIQNYSECNLNTRVVPVQGSSLNLCHNKRWDMRKCSISQIQDFSIRSYNWKTVYLSVLFCFVFSFFLFFVPSLTACLVLCNLTWFQCSNTD